MDLEDGIRPVIGLLYWVVFAGGWFQLRRAGMRTRKPVRVTGWAIALWLVVAGDVALFLARDQHGLAASFGLLLGAVTRSFGRTRATIQPR